MEGNGEKARPSAPTWAPTPAQPHTGRGAAGKSLTTCPSGCFPLQIWHHGEQRSWPGPGDAEGSMVPLTYSQAPGVQGQGAPVTQGLWLIHLITSRA